MRSRDLDRLAALTLPEPTEGSAPDAGWVASSPFIERVAALDWGRIEAELDAAGCAVTGPLFDPETCAALAALYPEDSPFRSRIVMARHGFGRGEYKY